MILCDRPCSNKSEYGYCNTAYCINPVIPNTAVGYFPPPRLIKTNADRIRSMTDEELASVITDDWCEIVCSGTYLCNDGTCEQHVLKWLKEEAGET